MLKQNFFGADGLAHPRDNTGSKAKRKGRERNYDEAKICIGCTRKKCAGNPECVEKRRRMLAGDSGENAE
jgi:hypothetical protein